VQRTRYGAPCAVERYPDETAWFAIRNTPGVTNFVGADGRPQHLPDEEVKHILKQWGRLSAAAQAGILEALAAGGGGPRAADGLWRIYEPTFRTEGAEAWAILETVGGILQRAAPEPKTPAVLDGLIRGLERIEGAPARTEERSP
jgi:transcription antitermination factor NusG